MFVARSAALFCVSLVLGASAAPMMAVPLPAVGHALSAGVEGGAGAGAHDVAVAVARVRAGRLPARLSAVAQQGVLPGLSPGRGRGRLREARGSRARLTAQTVAGQGAVRTSRLAGRRPSTPVPLAIRWTADGVGWIVVNVTVVLMLFSVAIRVPVDGVERKTKTPQ
ncbi:hypothetical protein BD413DRAFT_494137 [Trametes elegans]|nr:hypothetical protein BD413DRAFT_494137 [Trametes elegans]